MKFIHDDFLLTTEKAQQLYHQYAEKMPIVDYHCHLNPQEIAEDKEFENITQMWLYGDHYKWRLMRNCGVDEAYVTGNAGDKEKFLKWAEVLERCVGNPIYQWSMMELERYFEFSEPLQTANAEHAWEHCNRVIREKHLTARTIMKMSGVQLICTTDNPEDDLRWHKMIREDQSFTIRVLPAFRPDKAFKIDCKDFGNYVHVLEKRFLRKISTYRDFLETLRQAVAYFDENGCKTSDHGLDSVPFLQGSEDEIEEIFHRACCGESISETDKEKYQTALLTALAKTYAQYGWIMQLHYGASRNNNRRMFEKLGADTGYDCISGRKAGDNLPALLDSLEAQCSLPKTILYSLNPNENAVIDTVCACYHEIGVRGKVQHGSAWWFNDHLDGMYDQMTNLAAHNVLANFVGMLTDSRSFLSYTRHEYFRRTLCRVIGDWVTEGLYPFNLTTLGKIIEDISYYNTVEFFKFDTLEGDKQ